jgi:hypothetical protein
VVFEAKTVGPRAPHCTHRRLMPRENQHFPKVTQHSTAWVTPEARPLDALGDLSTLPREAVTGLSRGGLSCPRVPELWAQALCTWKECRLGARPANSPRQERLPQECLLGERCQGTATSWNPLQAPVASRASSPPTPAQGLLEAKRTEAGQRGRKA